MENLRALFENEYPGKKVLFESLIKPIFVKANDTTLTDEQELSDSDKKQIKSFRIIAQVRGSFPITFADIELQDNVALKRSRVNIQNCVRKVMENDSNALIFFHFTDNAKEWRVSYVNKADSLKNSTSAKRYTYLCGPEHSCRTIAERFSTLEGLSTIRDENMLEAFAVAPLSDDFFNEYRKHYADLVEYISGKRFIKKGGKFVEEKTKKAASEFSNAFNGDDKTVRDFVKKMMGRLVFLQFLQKKGWLGVPKNAKWGTGDKNFIYNLFKNADDFVKNDFLEQVLEPLFFKSLNCDRGEEAIAPKAVCNIYRSEIRIPYLNGGLFEEDELDKKRVKFKKEHFESIFEFFNQYNFTIDETDPDDVEIGVDPEMLGKIFENLLEDNKDKGAFYTPKEIVQYMCRESLIAYLETETVKPDETASKDKIRNFVLNHEASSFSEKEKADILKALIDVKICDPAVGSGAFPMGMLNELLPCVQILTGEAKTRVELKKHIVKNNIYGVDIEKGAVDIARLRFWLAIIVDEEEPLPLPNLDYKIMQGNSLLESFEGEDLSNMTKQESGNLFDNGETIAKLTQAINGFYIPHDHVAKAKIRAQIKENIIQLLKERQLPPKVIEDLSKLDLHENSQFFLWHTWFYDVFNRPNDCNNRNGFDIVIGNPPYIDSETMTKNMALLRNIYSKKFSCSKGNWDIFVVFIEQAFNLLCCNGIFSFIVPNKLIAAKYALELRKFLGKKTIVEIRDYSRIDVFKNADVYPITVVIRNSQAQNIDNTSFTIMKEILKIEQSLIVKANLLISETYWDIFFQKKVIFEIVRKMETLKSKSFEIKVLGAATVNEAYEIKKIIHESLNQKNELKFINTGTIDPYVQKWGIENCSYIKGKYLQPVVKESDLKKISETRFKQSKSSKIIVAGMSCRFEAVLDLEGEFIAGKSTTIILGNGQYLKFLISIINSKIASFWLNVKFNSMKMSGGYLNVGTNELSHLPIPPATPAQQQAIIALVDKILAAKKQDSSIDTTALESKIDEFVYDLYGLTEEEKDIIRNN